MAGEQSEARADASRDASTQAATEGPTHVHGRARRASAGRRAADAVQSDALRIGRFTVLGVLGRGGMGVVLSAYDAELDRRIALKLLNTDQQGGSLGRARLLREAQALGRLSHPNVVQVYDVGEHDGQVFVAMEFVRGQRLDVWLGLKRKRKRKRKPGQDETRAAEGDEETPPRPPWREIIKVFIQAGRGLAAAHEVGLVHRDFKPQNVIIGEDQRVRVLDFGLARAEGGPPAPSESALESTEHNDLDSISASTSTSLDDQLTAYNTIVGTPAYMSPEQHLGLAVSAPGDQFSFCAALFEGLYGYRPFRARSRRALEAAILKGQIEPRPRGTRVPPWVHRVVSRGLAVHPEERWPSMAALLAQLSRDPVRRRRRIALGVGLALATAAGGALGLRAWTERVRAEAQRCTGAARLLAGVWDEGRKQQVRAAMSATGLVYADDTWARAGAALDAYAVDWVAMHTEACETHQRGEQSDALFDRRVGCLGQRRAELGALVEILVGADAKAVENAVVAASTLGAVASCADVDALQAAVPPPDDPATRAAVASLRERLATINAQIYAGRFKDALQTADACLSRARELAYAPVIAEALIGQGNALEKNGDYEAAAAALELAFWTAERVGHDAARAEALPLMLNVLGARAHKHEGLDPWIRGAPAVLERAGSPARARYMLANALGGTAFYRSENAEALAHFEDALAITEIATPGSAMFADVNSNIANALKAMGRVDEARASLELALETYETALGPDHPSVGRTLSNLAAVEESAGRYAASIDYGRRALAKKQRALGPEHPSVAISLSNLGIALFRAGEYDEAREQLDASLALMERALGPGHMYAAFPLTNLGDMLLEQGDLDGAQAAHERALEIREAALGEGNAYLAYNLIGLGNVARARGQARRALPLLERALTLREGEGIGELERGEARFALARALWDAAAPQRARARAPTELDELDVESKRALELKDAALEDFTRAIGRGAKRAREQIREWEATLHAPADADRSRAGRGDR